MTSQPAFTCPNQPRCERITGAEDAARVSGYFAQCLPVAGMAIAGFMMQNREIAELSAQVPVRENACATCVRFPLPPTEVAPPAV